MVSNLASVFTVCSLFLSGACAQVVNTQLVGTWSSKSRKVFTGPGFYNPKTDTLIEPELTGISYSFTSDGFYEEALYRALSNPVKPSCPGAIMQWQHGTFIQNADSSLTLTPFESDGRQLMSQPCDLDTSILTRYHQGENFTKAEVAVDPYNNLLRLDLYAWDGTPINPMWLTQADPIMLPTHNLKPHKDDKSKGNSKLKRMIGIDGDTLHEKILQPLSKRTLSNRDHWFWLGLGFLGLGSVLYFCV